MNQDAAVVWTPLTYLCWTELHTSFGNYPDYGANSTSVGVIHQQVLFSLCSVREKEVVLGFMYENK